MTTLDKTYPLAEERSVSQAIWLTLFVGLTCAGAYIRIPTEPVPMTLQTPFVLLSGALLGAYSGAIAQLAYIALGLFGLPVFAFGGGPSYLFWSPTAGYLLAFPIAAFLTGLTFHNRVLQARVRAFPLALLAMACGLLVIFTLGTLRLKSMLALDWEVAFVEGFAKLQLWDAVKIGCAALLAATLLKRQRAGS